MFPDEVDATRFSWQMALVRRYCAPLALSEGVRRLVDGTLPPRAVAITFDDGYADNASVAWPILSGLGVPATFYIAPGFLDGGVMWNDVVIESIRRASLATLDSEWPQPASAAVDAASRRASLAEEIIRDIKHLPPAERLTRAEGVRRRALISPPTDLMMTRLEVRALSAAGAGIGAHTMTHPILRTLPDSEAVDEITGSRDALELITGQRIDSFAYPNGRRDADYTVRDRDLVASLGFDYAASTNWGVCASSSDVFQLPRFTPWDRSPERWLARLLLAFRQIG